MRSSQLWESSLHSRFLLTNPVLVKVATDTSTVQVKKVLAPTENWILTWKFSRYNFQIFRKKKEDIFTAAADEELSYFKRKGKDAGKRQTTNRCTTNRFYVQIQVEVHCAMITSMSVDGTIPFCISNPRTAKSNSLLLSLFSHSFF